MDSAILYLLTYVTLISTSPLVAMEQSSSQKLLTPPFSETQQKVLQPKLSYNHYFYRILTEIAQERGLDYKTQEFDSWIGSISNNKQYRPIIGFDIGLNSSAAKACCDDKAATSFILEDNEIPKVEHRLFRKRCSVNPSNDVWAQINEFWEAHQGDVVCKPKSGTCGTDIHRLTSQQQLTSTVEQLFTKYGDVCLSPYYEIKNEYRLIMLDYKPELVFVKERPYVIGNGKDTLENLIRAKHAISTPFLKEVDELRLAEIPNEGQHVDLTWKHNLCLGANAKCIERIDDPKGLELSTLASRTSKALNVRFASVDIIETVDGKFLVLEVNNGVMTEYLIKQHGEAIYQKIKLIFDRAIDLLFQK